MFYNYYDYYASPFSRALNGTFLVIAAAVIALIAGIVLFFTFMNPKHEGRHHGVWRKLYNFLNFNRFYSENLLRFLYVITFCILTLAGLAQMIVGLVSGYLNLFWIGAALLIPCNLAARILYELLMMFIILCRKTVSMDRRLSRMEAAFSFDDDAAAPYEEEPETTEAETSAPETAMPEIGTEAETASDPEPAREPGAAAEPSAEQDML